MNTFQKPNRLIHEKSPYLLQHAYNPVDWYPWGQEAFDKARSEDKPIFLSIGYSACHWCHVMERESFEDEAVAAVLNQRFVCIKVDKEERPDVDAVYMAACQAMTGQGGWPLTILMTPEQKPFFAATYIPKEPRYGMAGLIPLLDAVASKWQGERDELTAAGERIRTFLEQSGQAQSEKTGELSDELIRRAIDDFRLQFDTKNGGFGTNPKFPMPHILFFLMRVFRAEKDETLLQMAEKSLRQMARGGLFDHIGGGFCRYSTDSRWLVPHFERMLYDNALLSMSYLEAFQLTQNPWYLQIVQRTADYILREMTDEQGGFYSAQDADSEGEEGRYYLLDEAEIRMVLGEEHGRAFCARLDITPAGNFEGTNIPNRLSDDRFDEALPTQWLEKLDAYRKQRRKLRTDDKVLTAWNGLMIAALAKTYGALEDERYLSAAVKAAQFILDKLLHNGGLAVWYRDGQSGGVGNLDDYAFFIWALLELYDATSNPGWIQQALRLNERQIQDFYDEGKGGFYLYSHHSEQLIIRPKEVYDGAIPSGNSVAALNLMRLYRLTGDRRLEAYAQRQLQFIAGQIKEMPGQYSFSMLSVLLALYPEQTAVCVLPDDTSAQCVRRSLHTALLPYMTALIKTPQNAALLETVAPFTKNNVAVDGQPTAYFCENHACSPPIIGMDEWEKTIAAWRL